jgi:hypothetical protein
MTARWLRTVREHTGLRVLWFGCLLLGVLRVPLPVMHEHSALPGLDRQLAAHVQHCHSDAPATSWLDWHWHWLGWEEWCEAEGLEPGTPWTAPSDAEACIVLAHPGAWRGGALPSLDAAFAGGWSLLPLALHGPGLATRHASPGWGVRENTPGRVNPQSRTGVARC